MPDTDDDGLSDAEESLSANVKPNAIEVGVKWKTVEYAYYTYHGGFNGSYTTIRITECPDLVCGYYRDEYEWTIAGSYVLLINKAETLRKDGSKRYYGPYYRLYKLRVPFPVGFKDGTYNFHFTDHRSPNKTQYHYDAYHTPASKTNGYKTRVYQILDTSKKKCHYGCGHIYTRIDVTSNLIHADPTKPDSDEDGLTDAQEAKIHGTDPMNPDCDGDGLTDGQEINTYQTNPKNKDTDGDGMSDGWEIRVGLNPKNAQDALWDLDGDGLTNLKEYQVDSDPRLADTDGDGLSDYDEVIVHKTDPSFWDTDNDGLSDAFEIKYGLNPSSYTNPDADPDGDGLTTRQEESFGTNPTKADTDGDKADDGLETGQGSDPNNASDGGKAPPQEDQVKLKLTIASHGKQIKANCAVCHGLELRVGNYGAYATTCPSSDSKTYTFSRGTKHTITLKGRHCDRNGAGNGDPPTEETAKYTALVEEEGTGGSGKAAKGAGSGNKGKSLYIKDDQKMLGTNLKFEDNVLKKKGTAFLPKLVLKELGFKDDEIITQWENDQKIDANQNEPVWKQGQDPKPVCYIKNTPPKAFLTLEVTPTDMPQTTFSLRVLKKGTEIGLWDGQTLKAGEVKLDNLAFSQALSNDVDIIEDPLEWEWSLDKNKGWNKLATTNNKFYIVLAKPFMGEDAPLYDLGLQKACEYRIKHKNKTIAEAICLGVEGEFKYNGGPPGHKGNLLRPLKNSSIL